MYQSDENGDYGFNYEDQNILERFLRISIIMLVRLFSDNKIIEMIEGEVYFKEEWYMSISNPSFNVKKAFFKYPRDFFYIRHDDHEIVSYLMNIWQLSTVVDSYHDFLQVLLEKNLSPKVLDTMMSKAEDIESRRRIQSHKNYKLSEKILEEILKNK